MLLKHEYSYLNFRDLSRLKTGDGDLSSIMSILASAAIEIVQNRCRACS
jgi:hypothetical protein